jgi:hypothetical protein
MSYWEAGQGVRPPEHRRKGERCLCSLLAMYAVGLGPVECVGQADLVLPDLSGVTLPDILQRLTPGHSGG